MDKRNGSGMDRNGLWSKKFRFTDSQTDILNIRTRRVVLEAKK